MQDAVEFGQGAPHRRGLKMHDGIQGGQPSPRAVRHVEGAHVGLSEGERGVVAPGLRDHPRGQVDTHG